MMRIFLGIIAILAIFIWGVGCDDGDDVVSSTETAEIPASARTITFPGGTATDGKFYGPVVFSHEKHSTEYYNGLCIACHDHQAVVGETRWRCADCHSAGQDRENLCVEIQDHGCIMIQCQDCHTLEGPPAPTGAACGDCHS